MASIIKRKKAYSVVYNYIDETHTALVLKESKTKTIIRRVYLPKTVAYMLVKRKKEIDELMDLFGDE